jgi:hypothetical protein
LTVWRLVGAVGGVTVPIRRGVFDGGTVIASQVQQFASMTPAEFGSAIQPKWQLCDRLVREVQGAVEKQNVTPLDGARVISSITATLFGYDEFILREPPLDSSPCE